MALFYIWVFAGHALGARADEADDLYARRADLASARQAADVWRSRLAADPHTFDAAWKLSRADYWLGGHALAAERRTRFEEGIGSGERAVAIQPLRPEGHFWLAANMGRLAESSAVRAGLKYRGRIKSELEAVLTIDEGFLEGSAFRALGRWYFKVPSLLGGSRKTAEQYLRKSLEYNPHSTASHEFLAELFLEGGRRDEARVELQTIVDAPLDPDFIPEDQEFKAKARELLSSSLQPR